MSKHISYMSNKVNNYKLVILGDTAVGKSCVASRFVRNEFYEFQEPTIGAAFLTKKLELKIGDPLKYHSNSLKISRS